MTTFREHITKAMEHYQHLNIPEGDHTIGALVSAVLSIHTEQDAEEFYEGYIAWQRNYPHLTLTPEAVVRSNIGWCFGEGMSIQDKAMWVKVCGASHPVFGQADVTGEEAFKAGLAAGSKSRP